MKTNAVISLMSLMSLWMWTGVAQIFQPVLTSNAFLAKVTSNSVILAQPYCVFNQPCTNCTIWLVAGLCSANGNFDALANSSNIISLSPYPTAFFPTSLNFFLTRVGFLSDFPCNLYPNNNYFVVGADGICSGVNCNGLLPYGSTVCFKYLLFDANGTLVNSSNWSSFNLTTLQPISNIYDGLSARSGAMVVITTLLCVAAALLLLAFLCMLCLTCCTKKDGKQISVKNSIRMPRYDTHNLKERAHPYDNPAYQSDSKNYSASSTMPKDGPRKL